jgi:MFS family permease
MMATLGLVVGLAPVIGPSVGGSLLAWSAWPALFWLNVPIGMLALFLGWQFVPRGDPQRSPPMDWLGLALISLGLLMVVYALTELGARQHGTALPPVVLLAAGVGASIGFVWWSRRGTHPVVALHLVTRPVMAAGLLSALLSGASMFGAVLLLPLWFQISLGEGPVSTGLRLMPLGLGTVAVMLIAGRLTDRYGGGVIALVGSLVVLGSTVPFPWLDPQAPLPLVQALLLLRGGGLGLSLIPA